MTPTFSKALSQWIDSGSVPPAACDVLVNGVCQDSRLCEGGDAYLAIKGATTHGYRFATAAIKKGAVVVIVSPETAAEFVTITNELKALNVPIVELANVDGLAAELAAKFYDFPSRELSVVAVTGTDGKTSVCQFIKEALTHNGVPCGYIGTLGWGFSDCVGSTALTTPDAVALQRMLATMQSAGAQAVSIEASSHGIAEGRLNDIEIDIAVLTNLGRDHLDYHVSLQAYRAAKAQLFSWSTLKAIVVNGDDELGQSLIAESSEKNSVELHTYASSNSYNSTSAYRAKNVYLNDSGLKFDVLDNGDTFAVSTPLFGRFNMENIMACYAVLRASGIAANDSIETLHQLDRVPGRMEPFSAFAQPTVVVDYAHTPQALVAAISAVREHSRGQVWVVFGCGGDRDAGKRVPMAQAAEAADRIIVTDDNPRNENPAHIRNSIINGLANPSAALEIGSRERAIQYAIWHAQPDDVGLVAGKGHEDYQIVGTEVRQFSDREAVSRLLREVG